MLVIPAINETDFAEVLKKIKLAEKFSEWIHLDVVDGEFSSNVTWKKSEELKAVSSGLKASLEAHLMVENPEAVIKEWVAAGVKRVIVHVEAANKEKLSKLKTGDFEIGLAINPDTPVEDVVPYLENYKFVLVLGVKPGLAGQKFDDSVLEKIKFLKTYFPNVIIEADGGINLETAKLLKEAGADILVSASYLWSSENPEESYKNLAAI